MVQFDKCSTWLPSRPLLNFFLSTNFCCHLDGIRVLGVLFGLYFPPSSFLQNTTLDEDVCHVNVLPRLGDVQIAFGIFF